MRVPGALFTCGPYCVLRWCMAVIEVEAEVRNSSHGTASPARQRRKLEPQSSSNGCATLSEGNACSKQCTHKPSLTERRSEETVAEKKIKKNKIKLMKNSDRDSLLHLLESIDEMILQCDFITKLAATSEDNVLLKEFTSVLCSAKQPLQGIIIHHHHYFAALYVTSKKQKDAFL